MAGFAAVSGALAAGAGAVAGVPAVAVVDVDAVPADVVADVVVDVVAAGFDGFTPFGGVDAPPIVRPFSSRCPTDFVPRPLTRFARSSAS